MKFDLELDPRAIHDVQEAIDYYDEQLIGLGEKFEAYFNKYIKTLAKNPFYQVRYHNISCLPLKKIPFYGSFYCGYRTESCLYSCGNKHKERPKRILDKINILF